METDEVLGVTLLKSGEMKTRGDGVVVAVVCAAG